MAIKHTHSGDVSIGEDSDRTIFDTISDSEDPMDAIIGSEYWQEVDRVKQKVIQRSIERINSQLH